MRRDNELAAAVPYKLLEKGFELELHFGRHTVFGLVKAVEGIAAELQHEISERRFAVAAELYLTADLAP